MEPAERYAAATHAVQTGVAIDLARDPSAGTPKHLRTGLNLSMAEQGGLAKLLIAKGVITEAEYVEAMAAAAEDEKARYEAYLEQRYGLHVTLA